MQSTGRLKTRLRSLLAAGRFEEAAASGRELCRLAPQDAEAWFLNGAALGQLGRPGDAIASLTRSLSLKNDMPATHYNLGLLHLKSGNPAAAEACFRTAVSLAPAMLDARLELANSITAGGRPAEAIAVYREVLQQQPHSVRALANLGAALTDAGRHAEAAQTYRDVARLQPQPDYLFCLGNALRADGRHREAIEAYREALDLQPSSPGILNNLALCHAALGHHDDAVAISASVLELAPDSPASWTNHASHLNEAGDPAAATAVLRKGLERFPQARELHWDLSLLLLGQGHYREGWEQYEWRLLGGSGIVPREMPCPAWQGETLSGKSVLVCAEQGIGDEIMLASCYPDIAACTDRLCIDCEPRLAPLFRRSFPGTIVLPARQSEPPATAQCQPGPDLYLHAGSLPRLFRNSADAFPVRKSYLMADSEAVERWRQRYSTLPGSLRVGISWKGGHASQGTRRHTSLHDWLPVLTTADVSFINVQYGNVLPELDELRDLTGITLHHWEDSDPLTDMDDFAAQITALDLLISVDNSTVHLAGALGIETWLLQPFRADWRWGTGGATLPWYSTVRQFRPPDRNAEKTQLESVARALSAKQGTGI